MIANILVIFTFLCFANSLSVNKDEGAKFLQTDSSTQLLTQNELSSLSFALSDRCANQEVALGKHVMLGKPWKGKTFHFQIPKPEMNTLRVAFAGDSVTMGSCGTTMEQIESFSDKERLTDHANGVMNGNIYSYPKLTYDLLQNNNKTNRYQFFNYACTNCKITPYKTPGWSDSEYYPEDCRAEMLNKSLAHVVVAAFGGPDSIIPVYNEDTFIDLYVKYIKQIQALPQKPIVMLMVPTFNMQTLWGGRETITNPNDRIFPGISSKPLGERLDMQHAIYKVANLTGIPEYHVVNAWYLLRLNRDVAAKDNFAEDNAHPNRQGMGTLAQDFFMKMSESPEILHREWLVQNGMDENWNGAVRAQLSQQKKKK